MPHLPRRLATAAITLVATGAAAAPALAAGPSPLAKSIASAQKHIRLNIDETAMNGQEITAVVANAYRCDQAAALVAQVPAAPGQRAAKAQWLSGVRLQARDDVEIAAAVYSVQAGHRTAGEQQLRAVATENNHVDALIARADHALGIA